MVFWDRACFLLSKRIKPNVESLLDVTDCYYDKRSGFVNASNLLVGLYDVINLITLI